MKKITYQFFSQPSDLWIDAIALRVTVFVDEMGVPHDLEEDEHDRYAIHLLAKDGKKTVGTLRLVMIESIAKLGRVAVDNDYRSKGVGREMMRQAIHYCRQACGVHEISLGAQTHVTGFYAQLGFIERGEVFQDAGIPHQEMYLTLSND